MPKVKAKLTEIAIKSAKPESKPYKLYDEAGLLLLVRPSGTKVWQLPYQFGGKYNIYTIGQYPETSTADARKIRDEIKSLIKSGSDPNQHKRVQMNFGSSSSDTTFEAIAREWHRKQNWVAKHSNNILSRLERDVFVNIGNKQINQVTAQDIIAVLLGIEKRGALDVARRINQYCVAIFDYGIAKGLCEYNPAIGRTKILKATQTEHRAHLKEDQLPEFIEKLNNYKGSKVMQHAMRLLLLTFVRPGELRGAEWDEFDFDKKEWHIPAQRMKMKTGHIVPLSPQSIEILNSLREITGKGKLLFPGERKYTQPITGEALIKMLRIMGYTDDNKFTPHGVRATASTILNNNGFRSDVIERQLAHIERNKVRASYNHAEYMQERREMMQWWGDFIY